VNVGQPVTFSNTCCLIRHQRGTMIWDTGLADALAAMPNGIVGAGGNIHMTRTKTLAAQLAELNIRPGDINFVGVSHHHGDHVGNLALFTGATVLIQEAEYDAGQAAMAKPEYAPTQKINKLKGDHDVFGDGSVMILSTPGHTPGHQALLVNLPKTGSVLLTGDAVHLQVSWDNRLSPGFNFNKEQTVASIEKMAKVFGRQEGSTLDRPRQEPFRPDAGFARVLRVKPYGAALPKGGPAQDHHIDTAPERPTLTVGYS
jgi:glyoxylase-like metal-dependent hydrolase (beta-lactamase superfamily II)